MAVRVRYCAWCKAVTLFPGREDDSIIVMIWKQERIAFVNGERLEVEDGICEPCAAKVKAQKESPEAAAAIAPPAHIPKTAHLAPGENSQ